MVTLILNDVSSKNTIEFLLLCYMPSVNWTVERMQYGGVYVEIPHDYRDRCIELLRPYF